MDFTGNKKIARYRGYSSFQFEQTGEFTLTELELVKTDIMNHIFTRRGERVMMPDFGTSIPDLVFEVLDDDLVETMVDELTDVFEYDPRIRLVGLEVLPDYDANSITIWANLHYIELNTTESFDFNIQLSEG